MRSTFRSLRVPNYRRYAFGRLVSNVGTWMQRMAQDWLVLVLTGSGTALGITTGLQFLPVLLLSPYAGVIADRMSKRRLLQISQGAMGITSLVLGLLAVTGNAQVWHIYVIAFLFGIASAFDAPARQSFVSEIVGPDDISNAVALNSATFNTARILGPGVAGLLVGALGGGARATGWAILINAVSYLAVIWQLHRMDPATLNTPKPAAREKGMLRAGFRYLRGQPRMVMILIIVFFAGTFGMNFQITAALMATEVYGKGAGEFGLLGSIVALGSLVGALLAASRKRVRMRLLVGAGIGFGVANIVSGLMPTYVAFAAFAPVVGFCMITMLNSANAVLQLESEPLLRGRVMAIYMTIVMGGTPIGSPLIGWVGETFGARWTLLSGGMLTIAGVLVAVLVHARMTGGEEKGVRSILTAPTTASTVGPRVWANQAVARARK